ncbi:MAG: 2-hydroxyacyl-CoA dehydratase [Chloroflexi bacterium]|nr:2-hydroxyacyl-CoA dehydratase [Chloroflexota bacterium]
MNEIKGNKLAAVMKSARLLVRMNRAHADGRKSDTLYYQMLANYCERILKAKEEGRFFAAHSVFFPNEILYAMDIPSMHTEMTAWMTALFTGETADMLAAGAELGLASEICSAHRGLTGAYALGVLPRPDAILWSNLVCDNTAKCGELLMKINHCPGFFLERPFRNSDGEIQYLVAELKDMIGFLEEKSGHKMDWDKLSATVANMERQLEIYRDISELRKATPSPYHIQGFFQLLNTYYLFPGQPEAIEYLEAVRQELAEAVQAGKGAVPNERFRLMTLFIPPMYRMGFLEKLSQEFGAVSVTEPFFMHWGNGHLNPDRPLESIARHSYMIPEACSMYGPLTEESIKTITDSARDYKVHGAIYYANNGCRHTCATVKVFRDALSEIDVPMLTVDMDVVDPTFNSEDEMREKLQQFFELLEQR